MKRCPECHIQVPDVLDCCPVDGTPLVDEGVADTLNNEGDVTPATGGGDAPQPSEPSLSDQRPQISGVYLAGTELGAYRVVKLLGEGGMGRVYLAEHARLGRRVAIKVLRSNHTRSPALVQRFFREAQAVNQINHEHIVEITDFIEEDGGAYYIMEFLKGQTLREALAEEGPLPLDRSMSIAIQALDALGAVHQTEIVHRDLKPDNIFLTERWGQRDFVKLLDFGVVKLTEIGGDKRSRRDTNPGTVLGTPAYMSPEQAAAKDVDHRSDIYSIGVILYEMTTGEKPLKGKSYGEMVIQHLSVQPVPPNKVARHRIPGQLETLIMSCLEKDPDRRPQSAKEVNLALVEVAQNKGCEIERFVPTVYTVLGPPKRPHKLGWLIGGALAFAVGGLVTGVVVTRMTTKTPTNPDPAVAAPKPDLAPATSRITFMSEPAGAEVVRLRDDHVIGKTPVDHFVNRADPPELVELRLADHQRVRRRIAFGRDLVLSIELAPITRRRRLPRGKKNTRRSKSGTIDPFKKK